MFFNLLSNVLYKIFDFWKNLFIPSSSTLLVAIGTNNVSATRSADLAKIPNDGGQSINI